MGGGIEVEELPYYYYTYRRYPFGADRIPVYNPYFPRFWRGDRSTYHDNLVYGGNAVPMFVVEAPYKRDANSLVWERKLDGLKGEEISSAGYNATRNVGMKNGSETREGAFLSESLRSNNVNSRNDAITPTKVFEMSRANSSNSKHSSESSVEKNASHRVKSIPIVSTDEDKDIVIKRTVIPPEGIEKSRMAMSNEEAAVLIQSWFRGYQVQKTNPLTQLHHIAKVKSQLKDLDAKVSDADFINSAREDSLEKVKVAEGIMSLLLQLDTIQGAHRVVREIRKFATKEVISLQERLDALLSTDMADVESSQLPIDVEEESRGEFDKEKRTSTKSRANDSVPATHIDVHVEEESNRTSFAEPDPVQVKGDVSAVEESPERMELQVDNSEFNRSIGRLSTQMLASDQVGGFTRVLTDVGDLEVMELEASKVDVDEINERVVSQRDQPTEVYARHQSSLVNHSPSQLRYEDRETEKVSLQSAEKVSLQSVERTPEAAGVTTAEARTVRKVTRAAIDLQSGNVCNVFPQDSLQRNEEREREEVDDKINENGQSTVDDSRKPYPGNINCSKPKVEHSLADLPIPYSPKSPLEALDCLDFQPPISESEHQSELHKSPEINQDASAQCAAEHQALLLKLSEENKTLKSLLVTVMKWNQRQATSMQDVNHRLGKLESRIGKKKASSRRKVGKSSRMML